MSHMVIFRTPEGKPGYQPAETVHDAVAVVERLRNDEGVENVRIFRLEELSFEYRPYYKVEIAGVTDSDNENASAASITEGDSEIASADAEGSAEESSEEVAAEETSDELAPSVIAESAEPEASDAELVEASDPVASSEHPPWAAPPPPPPPLGGDFGGAADSAGSESDEFSGTGQRRGLFGR